MKKIFLATIAASLALTACETTSSRPYSASTDNIIAFQKAFEASGTKVQLGEFKAAEGVDSELTCRAMGALDVGSGKDPVTFIKDALKEEIFKADAYDSDSNNVLNGTITQFEANSWGTGSWELGMNLASDAHPEGIDANIKHEFKSSFSAVSACQNVVDAFTPAVQKLIKAAVDNPDFSKLSK